MGKIFGTDGARGVANREITCNLAMELGRAGAHVLTDGAHKRPRILIGRDPRASGDMLASAMIAGICSAGVQAIDIGVVTTPGIAYLTRTMDVDAGVMISASHNPVEDNGIKFFSKEGHKLSDELEARIERIIENQEPLPAPIGGDIGRLDFEPNAVNQYVDYLCGLMPHPLGGRHIVLDCANGSASRVAPRVFQRLGAKVTCLACEPDGLNINKDCGSTHPERLMHAVVEHGASMGFAFDGDADRVIAVDEKGQEIDGDQMMYILASALKQKGALAGNTLVATVMSNMGLEIALRRMDIQMIRTAVGDRCVLDEMLRGGYVLGGENSGHIILLSQATTGDGIVSALNLLCAVIEQDKKLSVLAAQVPKLPLVLLGVPVPNGRKNTLLDDLRIRAHIAKIEEAMRGNGRVLVRPSGTEPLVRIMIEGEDRDKINTLANELADEIAHCGE